MHDQPQIVNCAIRGTKEYIFVDSGENYEAVQRLWSRGSYTLEKTFFYEGRVLVLDQDGTAENNCNRSFIYQTVLLR